MTCWRRLRDWNKAGIWQKLHPLLLNRLGEADQIDWSRASLDAATVAAPELGRYRWVVEPTISWLNRNRRLKIRYERRADIHLPFLKLGCALICWKFFQEGFC